MFNLATKAYIAVIEIIYNFKNDQRGITTIEYGVMAVVMALLIVTLFSHNSGFILTLKNKFSEAFPTIAP